MKIRHGMEDKYKEGYQVNDDPYGHAVYTFLERWADLMEKDIERYRALIDKLGLRK